MKTQFNKLVVSHLPDGKHQDTKVPGLVCTVRGATRRFSVYIWARGAPRRKAIGDWPEWSVEAARIRASDIVRQLRSVTTPVAPVVTLRQLADLYTEELIAANRKTPDYISTAVRVHWQHLEARDIDKITPLEVQTTYALTAGGKGVGAARSAVIAIRTLYYFAERLELTIRNPAKRVRIAPAKARAVWLEGSEVATFYAAVGDMQETPRHFLTLALLTGLRKANLAGLRWDWYSGSTIIIPAGDSKNGEEMEIPLCPAAVKILEERRGVHPLLVFPPLRGASVEPRHWVSTLRRRMAALGCTKHFTLHDLRRSYAARLTALGAPLPVVAKALGHRGLGSTTVYARASLDTVRDYLHRQ